MTTVILERDKHAPEFWHAYSFYTDGETIVYLFSAHTDDLFPVFGRFSVGEKVRTFEIEVKEIEE